MLPYVAILVSATDSTWRAYLPDFEGCRAEGESAEVALEGAKTLALKTINGSPLDLERSRPRSLAEIRNDPKWARHRGINWPDAIVTLVTL